MNKKALSPPIELVVNNDGKSQSGIPVVDVDVDYEGQGQFVPDVKPVLFVLDDNGQLRPIQHKIQLKRRYRMRADDERDVSDMDEGYKRLVDRLDQDMRDHKQEIRDRDARLQADAAEREKRYHDEAKEREERIMATLERMESKLDHTVERMDSKIDGIADKIVETHRHTQIMSVTVILGVAAMVVAAIVGIVWPTVHSASPSVASTTTNVTSSK